MQFDLVVLRCTHIVATRGAFLHQPVPSKLLETSCSLTQTAKAPSSYVRLPNQTACNMLISSRFDCISRQLLRIEQVHCSCGFLPSDIHAPNISRLTGAAGWHTLAFCAHGFPSCDVAQPEHYLLLPFVRRAEWKLSSPFHFLLPATLQS